MIEIIKQAGEKKLKPGEKFRFACGPDLACFNTCCSLKRLPLWPYDVIRLRSSLAMPSDKILEQYAELEFDPVSGWPALRLRLDDEGRCPFVTPRGCRVYPDRPSACRLYPLARAARSARDKTSVEAVYLVQQTRNCHGWDQDREHTTESWTADQELEPYNQANDLLLPLLFHPRRRGRIELTPAQTHAVIAALYNPDVFRRMTGRADFGRRFGQERIERSQTGDHELMILGRDFLISSLFG